jgi:hypothetical protein
VKVLYSETSGRENVTRAMQEICSVLSRARVSDENSALGFRALYRIATHASISAKHQRWEIEQEYRLVKLVDEKEGYMLKKRESAGKTIQYLPLFVRAKGRRIAFAEIMTGPNQNPEEGRERLKRLLANSAYGPECPKYPEITASELSDPLREGSHLTARTE